MFMINSFIGETGVNFLLMLYLILLFECQWHNIYWSWKISFFIPGLNL